MIKKLSILALIMGFIGQVLASQPQISLQPKPRLQTNPLPKASGAFPSNQTGVISSVNPTIVNRPLPPAPIIDGLFSPGELPGKIEKPKDDKICRKPPARALRVLSIDGGGVRGVIPSIVIKEIERVLELPISTIMDAFGGTSVGGILSLIYTLPKTIKNGLPFGQEPAHSAEYIVNLNTEIAKSIFKQDDGEKVANLLIKGSFYGKGPLLKVLARFFGDKKISQTLKPVYLTTFDLNSESTFIISTTLAKYGLDKKGISGKQNVNDLRQNDGDPNISIPSNIQKKEWPFDLSFLDAARATSAAPLYFPVQPLVLDVDKGTKLQLVDGGVGNNNPVATVVREIDKEYCTPPAMKVLSLGTGIANQYYGEKDFQTQGGPLRMLMPTITGLFRVQEENSNETMKDNIFLRNKFLSTKSEYYRFQVYLERGLDKLDDASDRMLKLLEAKGQEIVNNSNFKNVLASWKQDLCNEGVYCAQEKLINKAGLHKKMCPSSRIVCVLPVKDTNKEVEAPQKTPLQTVRPVRPPLRAMVMKNSSPPQTQ